MIDLLIVLAFVAYSITMGFLARRKASRGLGEYFLAGKTLRGWQAGTSMAATQFAADTPLLVTGLIATGGIFMLWRLWIYGLAFLLLAFLFAGHWQRARVLTDAELTEIRYSGCGVLFLRVFKAIYYGTVFNCVVLAWVLFATVGIAEVFLLWHQWLPEWLYGPFLGFGEWIVSMFGASDPPLMSKASLLEPPIAIANNAISVLLIVSFTTLYSMTGGLRSVVATDVMQFVLAMLGTIFFAWMIISHIGGLGNLIPQLIEHYGEDNVNRMLSFVPGPEAAADDGSDSGGTYLLKLLLPFLVVMSLQWVFQINSDGTGYLAQRSMACENEQQARWAGVTFAWLQILLRSLPWLFIGVGLLVVYPFTPAEVADDNFKAARELTFVHGVNDLMPVGARGLLLTGMLAALASTLDTHMNWGASYWANDVYQRLICRGWFKRQPRDRELVLVARLSNLLVLSLALIVMFFLNSIQQAWQISLLFGAGVGSVLILRWLWERVNLWSELAAMAVSLLIAPLLLYAKAQGWWMQLDGLAAEALNLLIMSVVTTTAAIAITFVTPFTRQEVLQEFYRQVEPAGWWKQTASSLGENPQQPVRDLVLELTLAGVTGISLYLCLYGFARLLIPHPETSWFVPLSALVAGAALVPWWWPRVRITR